MRFLILAAAFLVLALTGCAEPMCPPARGPDKTPESVVPRRLLSGPLTAAYTREALACHIEGIVVARCWLTSEGEMTDCKIERGLPWLYQPVRWTLSRQTYTRGMPQYVRVSFRFSYPETIE